MGVFRFDFRSEVLGLYTDVTVTLPTGRYSYKEGEKPVYKPGMKFATCYLLHGGGEDDTVPYRNSKVELYAERNNVMTVTPSVNDSFYIDTKYGMKYFTYLTEELPVVIRSLFPSSEKREDNFVMGYAMGGNGALLAGIRRPDLYSACVDLSGGIGSTLDTDSLSGQLRDIKGLEKFQGAFGSAEELPGSSLDLATYFKNALEEHVKLPKLFIAVGNDDFIRDVVRKDRDEIQKVGIPLVYEEPEGYGHDWKFWDAYIEKAFNEWLPIQNRLTF